MQSKKPKVILLVPVYNISNRFKEWAECIYALKPKPYKVIFCENNSVDNTLELLTTFKLPYEIIRIWMTDDTQVKQGPYANIAHVRQLLLTKARQINPDYAIFLDDDIYVYSANMIEALTIWKKNIVGGAYIRVYPQGYFLASKWKMDDDKWQLRDYIETQLDEVLMTSGGCLCLSREVIQDKRLDFFPAQKESAEDYGYCALARKLGYKIWLDGTVKLQHEERHRHRPWFILTEDKVTQKAHETVKLGDFKYLKFRFSEQKPEEKGIIRLVPIYGKPKEN